MSPALKVSLGKSGLAWGIGLHPVANPSARHKKEGDGCAPAGIYSIISLFGKEDLLCPNADGLPFVKTTANLKCIDDPASRHYNRIVDQQGVKEADWESHEEMLRQDQRYAIGAVIAHNYSAPLACAGSCIFLHVWENEGFPTAGCTAGSPEDIAALCQWLNAKSSPLLVQLPLAEYERHMESWALPRLTAGF